MASKDKRNWLLALPVAGLGIGYLLLLGYLLFGNALGLRAAARSASLTPTPPAVDLWDAYEQAQAVVQAQASDAQLVSASAHWHGASEDVLLGGPSNWTFVFYSPASNHSLDVVANAGVARVVNQAQVWVTPTAMAEDSWRAGPGDAILVFLACGGRAFLDEHPQAVVDLHLAGNDEGSPVWTIVALDPETRSLLSLLVDAETGQVLSADAS
jgi:hypothetical protein